MTTIHRIQLNIRCAAVGDALHKILPENPARHTPFESCAKARSSLTNSQPQPTESIKNSSLRRRGSCPCHQSTNSLAFLEGAYGCSQPRMNNTLLRGRPWAQRDLPSRFSDITRTSHIYSIRRAARSMTLFPLHIYFRTTSLLPSLQTLVPI